MPKSTPRYSLPNEAIIPQYSHRTSLLNRISSFLSRILLFLLGYLLAHQLQSEKSSYEEYINYASSSNGAYIVKEDSSAEFHGILAVFSTNNISSLLSDDNKAGNCWAFGESSGVAVIQLQYRIKPFKFSIRHVNLAQYQNAPKDFSVWAEGNTHTNLMGSYRLNMETKEGKRNTIQMFNCLQHCESTERVILEVISNYGGRATCVYQFGIHGDIID